MKILNIVSNPLFSAFWNFRLTNPPSPNGYGGQVLWAMESAFAKASADKFRPGFVCHYAAAGQPVDMIFTVLGKSRIF